jgi:hypothetical protein
VTFCCTDLQWTSMSVILNHSNGVQTLTTRWRNSKMFLNRGYTVTSTQQPQRYLAPRIRHVAELHLAKYCSGSWDIRKKNEIGPFENCRCEFRIRTVARRSVSVGAGNRSCCRDGLRLCHHHGSMEIMVCRSMSDNIQVVVVIVEIRDPAQ